MIKTPIYRLKTGIVFITAVFFTAVFLFSQIVFSQSITWQRTYKSPVVNGDDEGWDGCPADGSNFYIVGSTGSFTNQFFILKIKPNGDTIWTRTFSSGYAKSVVSTGDGGCIFTGQRGPAFTIKMSSDGNIVWDKTYQNGGETRDIARTNDSGYILCGGFISGYICKIDTAGNLQWGRFYNDTPQDFHTIDLAIDGGYIVGGRKYSDGIWKTYLMKIDGAGNLLWEKFYINYLGTSSLAKMLNGYFIITVVRISNVNRVVLLKTDTQGTLLLADTLENNSFADYYGRILRLNNNKFIVSYISDVEPPFQYIGRITSFDSNMTVLRDLTILPDTNELFVYGLFKAPGTKAEDIICFGAAEPNYYGDLDVYVTRIDSSLSPPPPIFVTQISNEIPIEHKLFQNYPNPFNNSTIIKFTIKISSSIKLVIYDLLGKEVYSFSGIRQPGTYKVIFNGTELASGLYFYSFESNGYKDTKKMVLVK